MKHGIFLMFLLLWSITTASIPWPYPETYQPTQRSLGIAENTFSFVGSSNPILDDAFVRYRAIFFKRCFSDPLISHSELPMTLYVTIDNVTIPSYVPHDMDEYYEIQISSGRSALNAHTIWGALRGLETFSQLINCDYTQRSFSIEEVTIKDKPRFPYRGLMVDSARHFIPLSAIYQVMDGMAYNKLNVFHWHLTDDESFPYVSKQFPQLAKKGAFQPWQTHIYTPEDVANVVHYAYMRGIRVVPEFDTPGHFTSWTKGHPELQTQCPNVRTQGRAFLDPTLPLVYSFLTDFWREAGVLFPDNMVHLGGDELGFDCWKNNANITGFMARNNIASYAKLEEYYFDKIHSITEKLGRRGIVWQDVFNNNVQLDKDTVIGVWQIEKWRQDLADATAKGHDVLLYSPWYLNMISYAGNG